jgi:Uma2 family endonuclease
MATATKLRMTVDEFLTWSATQPGRFELVNGEVFSTCPERVSDGRLKFRCQKALERALIEAGLRCEVLPDGATVRVDDRTAYEPDALVYCGPPLDGEAIEVPNPVIVVEVLSPGTTAHDTGEKLAGYFLVASVQHYLIVDPTRKVVIHHRRGANAIETRIATDGTVRLDPPGIELPVLDLFRES